MAITSGGSAPYAPTATVVSILEQARQRGFPPAPYSTDVLIKLGVTQALAPRVLAALKLLDLVDSDQGRPTAGFDDLRKAPENEYKPRVEAMLRTAYADVFEFKDPNDPNLRDAFRDYTPHGQRDRMVTLFTGLCEYAGIIEEAPKRRRLAREPSDLTRRVSQVQNRRRSNRSQKVGSSGGREPEPAMSAPTDTAIASAEASAEAGGVHPFLQGLLAALPRVPADWPVHKAVFPKAARDAWLAAAQANFSVLYNLASESDDGGDPD